MKTSLSLIAALICFATGLGGLWLGRASIATSMLLLVFVSFWMLMGFLFALHADTTGNLQIIAQNVPFLRGLVSNAAHVSVAPVNTDEAHHE